MNVNLHRSRIHHRDPLQVHDGLVDTTQQQAHHGAVAKVLPVGFRRRANREVTGLLCPNIIVAVDYRLKLTQGFHPILTRVLGAQYT